VWLFALTHSTVPDQMGSSRRTVAAYLLSLQDTVLDTWQHQQAAVTASTTLTSGCLLSVQHLSLMDAVCCLLQSAGRTGSDDVTLHGLG